MKQIKFFVTFLVVVSLAFSGCNKNTDNNNPSGISGSLSLKYDGTNWTATNVQATFVNDIVNVAGIDNNNHQATITLEGISQIGTYLVGPGNPSNQLSWTEGTNPEDVYQANWTIGSGSVVVTLLSDAKIEGTFQFTGYNINQDSTVVTEGKFSAGL